MRNAKNLLDLLKSRFPSPRKDQNHSLTVQDGKMVLTLMQGNTWQSFDLTDDDLDKSFDVLVDMVAVFLETPSEMPVGIVEVPSPSIADDIA